MKEKKKKENNMSKRLLIPLDYLRIKHSQKSKYDYTYPIISTLIVLLIYYFLPVKPKIFGNESITSMIGNLLQILTGFYIVSLSAIATFNKSGMDSSMPGDPPTLKTTHRGKMEIIELTRRRFLCLLFGYLSFLSLIIYFFGGTAELIKENINIFPGVILYAKYVFLALYLFSFFNLMTTTFLGLYYMVDRIHKADPQFVDLK